MLCSTLITLALVAPPRADADGIPLPPEAVRRFGSLRWHADPPRSVAFSPNGKVAYLVPNDDDFLWVDQPPAVTAWELSTGNPLWQYASDHIGGVVAAADPDGKTVWVAGRLGIGNMFNSYKGQQVRVKLDAATGRELDRTVVERGWSLSVDLRPDGTFAYGRYVEVNPKQADLSVRILKPDGSVQVKWNPDGTYGISLVKFSPDGETLYVGGPADAEGQGKLAAIDVTTGKTRWEKSTPLLKAFTVSADGKTLAALGGSLRQLPKTDKGYWNEKESVHLHQFDLATGEHKIAVKVNDRGMRDSGGGPLKLSYPMSFSRDGKAVLFRSDEYERGWASVAVEGWTKAKQPPERPGTAFGWYTPDGKAYLAPTKQRTVALFDAKTHDPTTPPPAIHRDVMFGDQVSFSPDGKRVRWGAGQVEWDTATGKQVGVNADPPATITGVADLSHGLRAVTLVSPDGKWKLRQNGLDVRSGREKPPELLDAATDRPAEGQPDLLKRDLDEIGFSPDSKYLIATDDGSAVHLWEVAKGGKPTTLPRLEQPGGGAHLRIADGWAVVAQSKTTRVGEPTFGWSLSKIPFTDFKREKTWHGDGSLKDYIVTADGRVVGSTTARPEFPVYRNGPQMTYKGNDGESDVVLNGDNRPKHRTLFVIDPTADKPRQYTLPYGPSAAFSVDGRVAAFALPSGDIELYETATGKKRYTFTGLKRPTLSLAFSPDGKTLASESADGPVVLWDVRGDLSKGATPDAAGWAAAWRALGGEDAAEAFAAVRLLAGHASGADELKARAKNPTVVLAERAAEAMKLSDTEAAKNLLAEWAKGEAKNPLTAAAKK